MRRTTIVICIATAIGLSVCACSQSTQVESTEAHAATEVSANEEEEPFTEIRYRDGKAYLWDSQKGAIFGPCKYIYYFWDCDPGENGIFRYIDDDGLFGYAEIDGTDVQIIMPGTFSEAGPLSNYTLVKEGDYYYYIDQEGNRLTSGKYIQAYSFQETQGQYARVQKEDGMWCVIDQEENIIFDGYEYINKLPDITCIGTGIRDGKAALFRLGDEWTEEEREIVLDDFTQISDPFDEMAYVWTEDEKVGIVCWDDMIVEAEYTDVAYEMYLDKEDIKGYVFRCQKEDGYDVVFWEFNSGTVWKN
ncbi:MAG: hypothetical protein LUE86_02085 [Clostridiales bacterium]|nr:hypothetical protein [Clostridiales bacterium]